MSSITQFLSTPIGQTITVVSFARLFFTSGEGPHFGTPLLNLINPLTEILGNQLRDELPKNIGAMIEGVVQDSSVIVLASGIVYGVQTLMSFIPAFSFDGSMKISGFVGAVFFVKAASAPFLRKRFPQDMNTELQARWIAAVHLCPLVLTSLAAYYYDDTINLGQTGALTLGTFGVMKLLGWAFRKSCESDKVKSLINRLS